MGNGAFIASGTFPITPHDSTLLTIQADGFICDVAGTVSFLSSLDTTDTITCAANQFYPIRVKRINATGTTATGIHGGTRG